MTGHSFVVHYQEIALKGKNRPWFMAQLVRNPLQAIARRWWCRSLFRATRGQRRCPECTKS